MARLALGLAGAAIGNLIVPGIGGQIGFALGTAAGSVLFQEQLPTQYGPKLEDATVTTSTYGSAIPIVWGTVSVAGNIIDAGELITVSHKETSGGKGGPEQTTVTYTQYMDLCVAISTSANYILQIYANEKLIYDVTPSSSVIRPDWLDFTLYPGSETQEPDSTFEALRGIGNVPAYLGVAYVVFRRFNVTEFGTSAINFRFVVTKNGTDSTVTTTYAQQDSTSARAPCIIHNTYTDLMVGTTYRQTSTPDQQMLVAIDPYSRSEAWTARIASADYGYAAWVDSVSFSTLGGNGIPLYQPNEFLIVFNTSYPGGANPRLRYARFFYAESGAEFGLINLSDSSSEPVLLPVYDDHCVVYQPITTASLGDTTMRRHVISSGMSRETVTVTPPDGYKWGDQQRVVGCKRGQYFIDNNPLIIGFFENSSTGDVAVSVWDDEVPGGDATTWQPPYSTPDEFTEQSGSIKHALYDASIGCFWVLITDSSGYIVIAKVSESGSIISETNWNTSFSITDTGAWSMTLDTSSGLLWLVVDTVAYSWTTYDLTQTPVDYDSGIESQNDAFHPYTGSLFTGDIDDPTYRQYRFNSITGGSVSLQNVVNDICDEEGTNLTTSDRSATALSAITVKGFRISRQMQRRAAIAELAKTYLFDFVPRNGVLTAVLRGGSSSVTLDDDTLGAHISGGDIPGMLAIRQAAEHVMPKKVNVRFIDPTQNYETGHEHATRQASAGGTEFNLEVGVVLTHNEAAQLASVILHSAHIEREAYSGLAMPSQRMNVVPAGIVTADVDGASYPMRIDRASIVDGGIIEFEGLRHDASVYSDFTVGGTTRDRTRSVAALGSTLLWILDIPALRDGDADAGVYLAATSYAPTWNGCEVFDSIDGVSFSSVGVITARATAGFVTEALSISGRSGSDFLNTLTVRLVSGDLSSVTDSVFASNPTSNVAAVGNAGSWKIIRFRDASQNADGTWSISGMHHGLRDTIAEAASYAVGDRFLLLSQSVLYRHRVQTADIGTSRYLSAVTLGRSIDQATPRTFTPTGQAIKPFSPAALHAIRSGSDWSLSWSRQDRAASRCLQQPAMSESSESYSVQILDLGGIVVRTLSESSESLTYTSAQQTTDYGGSVDYLRWRVSQVSSVYGVGDYASLSSGRLPADYDAMVTARGSLVEYWDLVDTTNVAVSNSGSHNGTYAPGTYTHSAAGLVQDGTTCVDVTGAPEMSVSVSSWAAVDTVKSFVLWINADSLPANDSELANRKDTSGTKWWKCYIRASDAKVCFEIYDGSQIGFIASSESIVAGQTYQIAVNFDYSTASAMAMYFNSRPVASGTTTGTLSLSNNGSIRIGYNFGAPKFDGRWHKFAIYDANLTQAEIYTDAATGFGP